MISKGDHCHWWNGNCLTIGTNGFSMVFKVLRAMINDGFEVNDGFDGSLWSKINDSGGDEVAV